MQIEKSKNNIKELFLIYQTQLSEIIILLPNLTDLLKVFYLLFKFPEISLSSLLPFKFQNQNGGYTNYVELMKNNLFRIYGKVSPDDYGIEFPKYKSLEISHKKINHRFCNGHPRLFFNPIPISSRIYLEKKNPTF